MSTTPQDQQTQPEVAAEIADTQTSQITPAPIENKDVPSHDDGVVPKLVEVKKDKAPKKRPSVKGVTIGGLKKKAPIKKGKPETASELREALNELLTLLVSVREGNRRRWTDLTNADQTKAMPKLDRAIKKQRFYHWRAYGAATYLVTGHLVGSDERAVAYIVPDGRNFRWTIENSRSTSGTETTLQKAKETVLLYRDSFPA